MPYGVSLVHGLMPLDFMCFTRLFKYFSPMSCKNKNAYLQTSRTSKLYSCLCRLASCLEETLLVLLLLHVTLPIMYIFLSSFEKSLIEQILSCIAWNLNLDMHSTQQEKQLSTFTLIFKSKLSKSLFTTFIDKGFPWLSLKVRYWSFLSKKDI